MIKLVSRSPIDIVRHLWLAKPERHVRAFESGGALKPVPALIQVIEPKGK